MEIPKDIRDFVAMYYPDVEIAVLAGSFVHGKATSTSDFDIVIINQNIGSSYRETLRYKNKIYEVFVHSYDSCLEWFEKDKKRRKPSLQNMIAESIIIAGNNDLLLELKSIANVQIHAGPTVLSRNEIDDLRYMITDFMDDLAGSDSHPEWIFIINDIITPILKLDLLMNGQWLANGKRIPQVYSKLNPEKYNQLLEAFDALFINHSKKEFILWVNEILNQYGGRLDAGYCRGKN